MTESVTRTGTRIETRAATKAESGTETGTETGIAHALGASRTLWELVERRAALTPGRPVLLQEDRVLTFGGLRDRAAGLYGMGVRPGTVVA
ncbi:hypothetical protein [Streptomyces roseolus]|uniref:hypothetical protein n=1 Tax=Streptomyces roseolus TaxID=67358 RepID=UPI003F4D6A3F